MNLNRQFHPYPPGGEPLQLVGRETAVQQIRDAAFSNFYFRRATNHAEYTFLVAAGHVRSGKTRIGIETPMIVKEVCINMSNEFKFKEPVYLKIDFLNGAKFNPLFDTADLLPSQALGGRLMNAFYTGVGLKKVSHSDALKHIVDSVRGNETDSIVPIVIHFDEHGEFIAARNEFLENNYGKKYFLNMLMELGSAATSNSDNLGSLHNAGSFFIVPITTGTSHSDANFDSINTYSIQLVSLPILDSGKTEDLAVACLQQFSPNVEIAAVLSDNLFQIALGDTGGLPGLIFYACLPGSHSYFQNLFLH